MSNPPWIRGIHVIKFCVYDRDGNALLPTEFGLKYTVPVNPASAVRVIAELAEFADPEHPYMYPCRSLEHELQDDGPARGCLNPVPTPTPRTNMLALWKG